MSDKVYDGKMTVPTLNAMRVQNCLFLGLPLRYPAKSTVNEMLKINHTVMPDPMERPTAQFLVVGNRGHVYHKASNAPETFKPVRHASTDSGMFGAIPLALRPIDNDFSDEERKKYLLRVQEEHHGRRYWAYYGLRIDLRAVENKDYEITQRDGQESVKEHVYTDKDLNPDPTSLPNYDYKSDNKLSKPDGRYVISNADVLIRFDDQDVIEYQNVAKVLYNDQDVAMISEIAICTGVNKDASGNSVDGSPFTYKEGFGVQIAYHMTCYNNIAVTNDRLSYMFKIGQTKAFFVGA